MTIPVAEKKLDLALIQRALECERWTIQRIDKLPAVANLAADAFLKLEQVDFAPVIVWLDSSSTWVKFRSVVLSPEERDAFERDALLEWAAEANQQKPGTLDVTNLCGVVVDYWMPCRGAVEVPALLQAVEMLQDRVASEKWAVQMNLV